MTTAIDVTLLPAPEAIKPLSYAGIKAERLASLRARFETAGLPWDVGGLETDPAVILQEEDAFRELLDKAAINDSVRAVLAAFARAGNLDHLVALANVERLTLVPADPIAGTAAVMESDTALLRRFLASFSAPAAGSQPAYVSRALAAWPAAHDVDAFKTIVDGQPRATVVLLAPGGAAVPPSALSAVYAALSRKDAAPLTSAVQVEAATVVPWTYAARLTIGRGPDAEIVRAEALVALRTMAAARYRLGGFIPANAPAAALYVPNVTRVAPLAPFVGIEPARDAAPWLASATIEVELA